MSKSKHYYIRKAHRFLGVILGIQFLFWTVSGIYFSWSNIDEIHGDFEKKMGPMFSADMKIISPKVVLDQLVKKGADSIVSIQLINFAGDPLYQIRYIEGPAANHHHIRPIKVQLADALTGQPRLPLSKDEAIALAVSRFNGQEKVKEVVYMDKTGSHHEYRGSPLPAYGVTFNNSANTTVYVASELATVQSFRNNKWRIFDFLWMTHTMDYRSRDDFGNILLRVFSIFGLVTVISGFVLFFVSSKTFRRKKYYLKSAHDILPNN
jgi:uncharacterized iron-regulated membrane protein